MLLSKNQILLFFRLGEISKKWANKFTEVGTTVIDNSSAWRMEKEIPLIVPEINAGILTRNDKIIFNPNCSTIQLVLAKNIPNIMASKDWSFPPISLLLERK